MKNVLIFGSTGSIGQNALKIIKKLKNKFKVIGLCANRNSSLLIKQAKEFRPKYICLRDQAQIKKLKGCLGPGVKLFSGEDGLDEFSALGSDISIMAISGIGALRPLMVNLKHTKRVALANKESLVTAGKIVFKQAAKFKTEILPVDSEINALFQLINNKRPAEAKDKISRVYITASGGALFNCKKQDLSKVKAERVLSHPTWSMGRRITIDCATLVNKAFEAVETHFFFALPYEKIEILIHRESRVHALVEYSDNTLLGCLYPPDMKIPISFALLYPQRFDFNKKANLAKNNTADSFSYSFSRLKQGRYPLLDLVLEAAKRQDNSLVVLNACDEIAVESFLAKKIRFTDIHKVMQYMFANYIPVKIKNISDVFYWDNWAREKSLEFLRRL